MSVASDHSGLLASVALFCHQSLCRYSMFGRDGFKKKKYIMFLFTVVQLIKAINFSSHSYFQPQSPKGTSEELQFWLFLLVTHHGESLYSSNPMTIMKMYPGIISFKWISLSNFSMSNSWKTPTLHRRTGCIMTSAKRCCNTLSRATMSASLLMDRREQANRTLWWGNRKRDKKESFPWFVQCYIDLALLLLFNC